MELQTNGQAVMEPHTNERASMDPNTDGQALMEQQTNERASMEPPTNGLPLLSLLSSHRQTGKLRWSRRKWAGFDGAKDE